MHGAGRRGARGRFLAVSVCGAAFALTRGQSGVPGPSLVRRSFQMGVAEVLAALGIASCCCPAPLGMKNPGGRKRM